MKHKMQIYRIRLPWKPQSAQHVRFLFGNSVKVIRQQFRYLSNDLSPVVL